MLWEALGRKKSLRSSGIEYTGGETACICEEATEQILEAKKEKRLTYAAMAEQLL